MNGLYAFGAGILAILICFLAGKKTGRKEAEHKAEVKIQNAEAKASKAETERDIALDTVQIKKQTTAETDSIKRFFDEFEEQKAEADKDNNIDYAIAAAQKLAERARQWQERNNV